MNKITPHIVRLANQRQRGFTLIELMIAITVALFLIIGLLFMVQSTRDAFGNQNLLAQLQDDERLVMTFMAEVVESAGYFPNPQTNVYTTVFPVTTTAPVFATPGQSVFGISGATATGDSVTIRYAALQNDNVFNCMGLKNTTVTPYDVFVNTFAVQLIAGNPTLVCTVSSSIIAATPVALVNGVQNLTILYGVQRSTAGTGSCADTYLKASEMAPVAFPNDWLNVCSVDVTIAFTNPLKPAGAPIVIRRVIAAMTAAGVNSP
jgi:type IV pilus assembly protein PilW